MQIDFGEFHRLSPIGCGELARPPLKKIPFDTARERELISSSKSKKAPTIFYAGVNTRPAPATAVAILRYRPML
jgi:hypothetical protein